MVNIKSWWIDELCTRKIFCNTELNFYFLNYHCIILKECVQKKTLSFLYFVFGTMLLKFSEYCFLFDFYEPLTVVMLWSSAHYSHKGTFHLWDTKEVKNLIFFIQSLCISISTIFQLQFWGYFNQPLHLDYLHKSKITWATTLIETEYIEA